MAVGFQKHEVEDYERKRYRGLDQRIVHSRERRILRKIFKKTGGRVLEILDLPCGYGRFTGLLRQNGDMLISSDISYHMVQRTVEKTGEPSHHGVIADAIKGIPLKSNECGLVFSMRFFHHLHSSGEREAVFKEFARVTKKWVVLSFYKTNPLHKLQRKFRKKVKKSRTSISMIPFDAFRGEAEKCGLKIIRMYALIRGIHAQHIVLLEKVPDKSG